jgi:hypothetical protein
MTIYQGIAAVMRDVDAIGKTKRNQSQGFNFRGIDDVYNAIHPLMAKYGIFTLPEVLEDRTEDRQTKNGGALIYRVLKIKYTFCAEDGSSVSATVIGEGMDSGDKASNKAMSIAHKYAFFQVFCIPTEELAASDPDNYSHEVASVSIESILDKAVSDGILTPDKADDTLKAYEAKKPAEKSAFVQAVKNKLEKTAYENLSRGQ